MVCTAIEKTTMNMPYMNDERNWNWVRSADRVNCSVIQLPCSKVSVNTTEMLVRSTTPMYFRSAVSSGVTAILMLLILVLLKPEGGE